MKTQRLEDTDNDEYDVDPKKKKRNGKSAGQAKRRKTITTDPLGPLRGFLNDLEPPEELPFEDVLSPYLESFVHIRDEDLAKRAEMDNSGQMVRPLTRNEVQEVIQSLADAGDSSTTSNLVSRKLKLDAQRRRLSLPSPDLSPTIPVLLNALSATPQRSKPHEDTLVALQGIKSTPFSLSFLSRLVGSSVDVNQGYIHRDWDQSAPWLELMQDIRDHHALFHPERDQTFITPAPIDYQSLQPGHLRQVHDLLCRTFWDGIDISDSVQPSNSPEKCTIVATYKRLVVGGAFFSSPQEAYITYLAVRPGWENAYVATNMLYHLIERNPHKDIILHVSANSPAMLLYNRFGFKAEEFIVGFYDKYLPKTSHASKNAFRLRLRR